jgi:ADP-heptose:LPS heptosyltransferase
MSTSGEELTPRRILLIQLRRLGDVILSSGILEDLRRAFPDARIDMLTGRGAAPLLQGHPDIDDLLIYDAEHPWGMVREIRGRRYDWIIDGQSSPRTAWLARFSGARVRAGWGVRVWSRLYTHVLPRAVPPMTYMVRDRKRFLEMLGVPVGEPRTLLVVTEGERVADERAMRAAGIPDDIPRVALVLSVSEPMREWPAERYAALAVELSKARIAPALLENPGDSEKVERFRAAAPMVPIIPTHQLRSLLAAISLSDVLVSGDTGPAHMATALGVPRVTIYGPTDPDQWNPGLPTTTIVRDSTVPLTPARKRRRQTSHPGLLGVHVDTVLEAVLAQVARRASGRQALAGTVHNDSMGE